MQFGEQNLDILNEQENEEEKYEEGKDAPDLPYADNYSNFVLESEPEMINS